MADAIPLPIERWLPVPGWEGIYEVSDHGRVRRIPSNKGTYAGRIMATSMSTKGYRRVVLKRDGREWRAFVHVLVLRSFVGPCPPGHQCNHKDGDKANNRLSNLEWVTPKRNSEHALETGLRTVLRGEQVGAAKLTSRQVAEIRRLKGSMSQQRIAELFGVSASAVGCIHRGERWRWFE